MEIDRKHLLPEERELLSSYGFDKFDMLLQRLAESRAEVARLNHIIKCVNRHLDKDVSEIVEESGADHAD